MAPPPGRPPSGRARFRLWVKRHPATVLLGGGALLAGLLVAGISLLLPGKASAAGPAVRVLLASLGSPRSISLSGAALRALGPEGEELEIPSSPPWTFRAEGDLILGPGGKEAGSQVRLAAEGPLLVGPEERPYPGTILLRAQGGKILVLNLVPMEAYVAGVVAGELGNRWPYQALLAQAVAARTYALWTRKGRKGAPWDLADRATHQVYQGYQEPDSPVASAAGETRGMVLAWKGRVIPAWYHSVCGGHTARAAGIFPQAPDIPPLAGVACPWCEGAPYFRWEAGPFPLSRLEKIFGLPRKETILGLECVKKESASGRWLQVRLVTDRSSKVLPFRKVRRALGLRSSLILQAGISPAGITFRGGGWGHGVGLCQRGAVAMALAGRNWKEILAFYYPGAEVVERW